MTKISWLVAGLLGGVFLGCGSNDSPSVVADSGVDATVDVGSDLGADVPVTAASLASGITLDGITFLQGTSVAVVAAGAEVTKRNAPIVAGRDAVVRLFVTPGAEYVARDLVGRITITTAGTSRDFTAPLHPTSASTEGRLASTFDVEVPGDAIAESSELSARIEEKAGATPPTGSTAGAQWPATGTLKIGAQSAPGNFKIVLVPFKYVPDASNRLPDTSAAAVKKLSDGLAALYPVSGIDVTVHDPVDLGAALAPTGTGWNEWLVQLQKLRETEAPKTNVFYLGAATPGPSTFAAWCSSGCVSSLAPLGATTPDPASLAEVFVTFPPDLDDGGAPKDADGTTFNVAHTMANALGQQKAPCGGATPLEPGFPYPDGTIGVSGYDRRTKTLLDPKATKDFTSYCQPPWTSDYTFSKLFARIALINDSAK